MMPSSAPSSLIYFAAIVLSLQPTGGFVPCRASSCLSPACSRPQVAPLQSKDGDDANGNERNNIEPHLAFPVVSRIAGLEFTGDCRYVDSALTPLTSLKLSGGTKYDITNGTTLQLTSFLTFPNGKTRTVVMQGERQIFPPKHEVTTLDPVDDAGPIVMQLSEVYPDTILINEVEKATGRVVMTTSLSIVKGVAGMELVGVSHEVGGGGASEEDGGVAIEGHQVWRMAAAEASVPLSEFDYRSATSW